MPTPAITFTALNDSADNTAADLLVVTHFEEQQPHYRGTLKVVNTLLTHMPQNAIEAERFTGKLNETVMLHTAHQLPANRVLIIGLGKKEKFTLETVRRVAGRITTIAKSVKAQTITIGMDDLLTTQTTKSQTFQETAQAFTEGVLLASYQFLKYKSKQVQTDAEYARLKECRIVHPDKKMFKAIQQGIELGQIYANATITTRDMVSEPAVNMKPKTIAQAAEALGKQPGIQTKIYNKAAITKLKMGSFLSVAAGSDEEPYLIHLSYKPKGLKPTSEKKLKKVVLCGKGITFDSGGLSLKPSNHMDTMKTDMAGAAAIIGLFSVITQIKPNLEVHGVIPATENMPSGKATRPGDVVRAYNGKTIEIMNTDAEGRLILADALAWAEDTLKPDYMIDLATLTGAAIVALGQEVAPVYSTDAKWLAQYLDAAKRAGEQAWELPLVDEYRDLIESPIADIQNVTKVGWAGSITAALFLTHFVKSTPWIHVDIAGPAWVEKQVLPYAPVGASGYSVRTLLNLVRDF